MKTLKTYYPYDIFKKYSSLWENQINNYLSLLSGKSSTYEFNEHWSQTQNNTMELFRKNQEAFTSMLNVPTKKDITKLSEQNVATEEKIELLEAQILSLQESIKTSNKDLENIVAVSKQMMKLTKQLKTELTKTKKELAERKEFQSDLKHMNDELALLNSFKEEIVKSLIDKGEQKETVITGSNQPK
jgi:dGTP triphosphohydrolase